MSAGKRECRSELGRYDLSKVRIASLKKGIS